MEPRISYALVLYCNRILFSEEKAKNNIKAYVGNKARKLLLLHFVFAVGSYLFWLFLKHDRPIIEPLYDILGITRRVFQ